jgi:hypothetical protein
MLTFHSAVARKDSKGYPKDGFQMEKRIDKRNGIAAENDDLGRRHSW